MPTHHQKTGNANRQVWLLRDIDTFLTALARTSADVFFIQIGANDGRLNDPIYRHVRQHNWRGIILEPLKAVFEQALTETYRGCENITLENAAISDTTGTAKLYRLSFSNARWATGLSSFRREVIEKHIDNGYIETRARQEGDPLPDNRADYIGAEDVPCMTFSDLLDRHRVTRIDLLQIDTEGYDYEILKQVDFDRIRPALVNYESKHLDPGSRADCTGLLHANGYLTIEYGDNTLAVRNGLFNLRGIVVDPPGQ